MRVDELLAEAEAQPFTGWDFSWLGDRMQVERPWDYTQIVLDAARRAPNLLDMGTGGGEWLAELPFRPRCTIATEAWPPNVVGAARHLRAVGVPVVRGRGCGRQRASGRGTTAWTFAVPRRCVPSRGQSPRGIRGRRGGEGARAERHLRHAAGRQRQSRRLVRPARTGPRPTRPVVAPARSRTDRRGRTRDHRRARRHRDLPLLGCGCSRVVRRRGRAAARRLGRLHHRRASRRVRAARHTRPSRPTPRAPPTPAARAGARRATGAR